MKTIRLVLILFTLLACLNAFCMDGSGSITSGGKTRSFVFHAPGTSVSENLPLLLVFHGDNGSGTGIRTSTGFNATADANNFIVVYPDADSDGGGWHRAVDQTKDVVFTSELIDYFCSTYHIDAKKVYATGHSAGGYMTYNLAVNLPSKIAAFAPVAGNMYATAENYNHATYFSGPNFKPVPILHIHGDPDPTVSYPDPDHQPTAWSEWPLTQFSYYTCNKTTYTLPNDNLATNVTKLKFCVGDPPGTKEISMIRVAGAGHGWPKVSGFDPNQAIWDFVKDYSISEAQSCAPVPEEPTFVEGTIHSEGRTILGPCNSAFIPLGMNYSLADDWEFPANINGDPTNVNDELSTEIIKANPNTVRVQWYANRQNNWKPYSVADLDVVVTRFKNAGIVSILELHDVTCSNDYTKFNSVVMPWWKQQSVLDMIEKHKGFVIVNVANEFGTVQWASNPATAYTSWLDHYKTVVTELRNAGIEVPLMIDAPDCGQNLNAIMNAGPVLKSHDPLHNIIMSAHAYWYLDNEAAMEARTAQIANANFPIVLGEIANIQDATGPCTGPITAYQHLLKSCKVNGIGWLAWTWTDDWCDGLNGRRMSLNGSYTNLSVYGQAIINDPDFGLKTNAIKMDKSCLGGSLPVTLISFAAVELGEGNVGLKWETSSEIDFKGFDIERSVNGKSFLKTGHVSGKGSDSKEDYAFTDNDLPFDTYYYRLKMIDNDGSYSYSKMVNVTLKRGDITVYPSPARDYVIVKIPDLTAPVTVKLINESGKTLLNQTVKKPDQKINIARLKEGLYIVTMNDKVVGKVIVLEK